MIKIIGLTAVAFVILMSKNVFADLDSTYTLDWLDDDKHIFVLQNKEFTKANQFIVSAGFLKSDQSPYQSTSALSGSVGYFFNDNWSTLFRYNKYSNSDNVDLEVLLKRETEPFVRRINSMMSFYFNWSPFYGKVNIFNSIVYIDWILGLGYSKISGENNKVSFLDTGKRLIYTSETANALSMRSAFMVYLTDTISVNLDVALHNYKADVPLAGNELYQVLEIGLMTGFRF